MSNKEDFSHPKHHGKGISKELFEKMSKRFQDKYKGQTRAVTFSIDSVKRVIDQQGAQGVRIYFGVNEDEQNTVMLVAVNESGETIYSAIEDRGGLCPPYCG